VLLLDDLDVLPIVENDEDHGDDVNENEDHMGVEDDYLVWRISLDNLFILNNYETIFSCVWVIFIIYIIFNGCKCLWI